MAALHRLLSQARRYTPNSSSSKLIYVRSLCSSSSLPDPNPNPPSPPNEPNRNRPPQSASVHPVSYPIKDPSPQPDPIPQNSQPNNNNVEPRGRTREDVRFVKDFNPSLSSSLSSSLPDPDPNPNPHPPSPPYEPNRNRPPQSASVQPVSYPIKDPSPQPDPIPQDSQPNNNNVEPRGWTREDARFVKDFNPSLSFSLSSSRDVNFGTRVAPLPKDKTENEIQKANDELEAERMKIQAENRVRRSVFRTVVEEPKVPFPTLIKVDPLQKQNKAQKVVHDLKEAVRLVKENAKLNFDETLEAHVKLAVDLRRTDLKLTGSLSLPHGSGKALRVAVFADGAAADEARAAGADMVGGEDLIEGIKNGTINVKEIDKCIAVPQLMPRIGKEISKKLNRLTPNARDGSVTTDISTAVKEAKKNIKFKKDKSAIVHVGLGKVSFTEEALCENVGAFVNALLLAKPAGLKKSSKYAGYVTTFHICSTMGPSYPVSIQSLSIAADRYTKLQMR